MQIKTRRSESTGRIHCHCHRSSTRNSEPAFYSTQCLCREHNVFPSTKLKTVCAIHGFRLCLKWNSNALWNRKCLIIVDGASHSSPAVNHRLSTQSSAVSIFLHYYHRQFVRCVRKSCWYWQNRINSNHAECKALEYTERSDLFVFCVSFVHSGIFGCIPSKCR